MQPRIKRNLFFQFLESALLVLLPLITFPYISRILGPEKIGLINFVDFTAQIFLLLTAVGIPTYGVREVAKAKNDQVLLQKLVSQLLTLQIIACTIGAVIFILLLNVTTGNAEFTPIILLAALNIFFNAWALDWYIKGIERFRFLTYRLLISRIAVVIAVFLLIKNEGHYVIYYTILIGGSFLVLIADFLFVLKNNTQVRLSSDISPHLKPLSLLFYSSVSISIYTYFDTFLLGLISGTLAVGFYTTAFKVVAVSQRFVRDISMVLLPRFSSLVAEKNIPELERVLNKALLFIVTLAVPIGVLFFISAPEIILLLGGAAFSPAISTLQILSFLPLIIGISTAFGNQVLIPFGREKELLKVVIAGSIVSIILCLILCPFLQHNGAAIACVLAELIVTILAFHFSRQIVKVRFSWKQCIAVLLSALIFIPVAVFLRIYLQSSLLIFASTIVIGGLGFALLQLSIFKNPIMKEIVAMPGSFLKNKKEDG